MEKKSKKRKQPDIKPSDLPYEIIGFDNKDKPWHESWYPGRDPLNLPHPWRVVACGPPGSGKSTIVKNLLARADPPFKRIVIVYPGGKEGTMEYEALDGAAEYLDSIPPPEHFPTMRQNGKGNFLKTLVVIDDYELKEIGKHQRASLDRLVGHVSTHRNVSVVLCTQDYYNFSPIVRRCASTYILWKPRDHRSINTISQRIGQDMAQLFELCKGVHDSIWIDLSPNTPLPLRFNGYIPILRHDPKQGENTKQEEILDE